jgi:aspartate kinase
LAQKEIPLRVRSFLDPDKEGTRIGPEMVSWNDPAFIRKENQTLISFTSKDFSFMAEENISEILHAFSQENLKIHMLQVSALSISVVTELKQDVLARIVSHMKNHYSVLYNENLTLYTIKNYTPWAMEMMVKNKSVILDQRSRNTCQILVKSEADTAAD